MPKVCKECGHQLDDNAQLCPNCGCPCENASASAFMDKDVLNKGKRTDAESIISDVAEAILKWSKIVSIIVASATFIGGLLLGFAFIASEMEVAGVLLIIVSIPCAILNFYLIRLFAKIIWGIIMLFVNISTTLKRIEIKLEENGTH